MKDDLDHTDNEVSSTEDTDSVESPPIFKKKIDAFEVKNNYLCIDDGFIVSPNRKSNDFNPTVEDRLYAAINFGGESGYRYVKALLDENKDLDLNNPELPYYTYPLHYSIILREERIAEELIKRGSNVNLIDDIGMSPINYAVGKYLYEYKNVLCTPRKNKEMRRIVTLLLLKGSNIFYMNPIHEIYPHQEAIRNDFYYSSNAILKRLYFIREKKINNENQYDQYISMENNIYVSKIITSNILNHLIDNNEAKALELLENGVKIKGKDIVNEVDDIGQTFLFYAFARGMYSVMRFLVLNGTNVLKVNKIGLTALDLEPIPIIPDVLQCQREIEKRASYIAILLEEVNKNNGVLLSPEYYLENLKQKKNEIKKEEEDLIQRQSEYNKKSIDDLLSEIDSLDSTKQEKEKETVVNKKKRKKILSQNKKENKEAKRLRNEKLLRMTFLLNKFYKERAFRIFSEKIKIQKDLEIKTIEMNKSKKILEKSKEKRKKKLFKKITMNIARSKIINTMNRINKNGSNIISKVLKNIRHKKRFIGDKIFFFPFELD